MAHTLNEALSLFTQEAIRLEHTQEILKKEIDQLREKLNASHETLETLFSSLADGLIYINASGIIELVNVHFLDLFEREKKNLIGKPYLESFSDDFFGFSMGAALEGKKISRRLFLNHKSGKRIKELEIIASPVQSKKGGLLLMIKEAIIAKCLAATSEKRREWQELHEMMGSFAHEIKNPLTGIQGYATLLLRELKEETFHEMVDSIIDGTKMITRLVDDALSSTTAPTVHLAECDLISLIEETLQFTEVSLDVRNRFLFSPSMKKLLLFLDTELFKRALFNILKNGHEASPHLSAILIDLKTNAKEVEISIRDRGVGIDPKQLERLFAPTFSTKEKGHGFGLFESYKALSALGGTISVQSELNEGSTFIIKLPIHHATRSHSHC